MPLALSDLHDPIPYRTFYIVFHINGAVWPQLIFLKPHVAYKLKANSCTTVSHWARGAICTFTATVPCTLTALYCLVFIVLVLKILLLLVLCCVACEELKLVLWWISLNRIEQFLFSCFGGANSCYHPLSKSGSLSSKYTTEQPEWNILSGFISKRLLLWNLRSSTSFHGSSATHVLALTYKGGVMAKRAERFGRWYHYYSHSH